MIKLEDIKQNDLNLLLCELIEKERNFFETPLTEKEKNNTSNKINYIINHDMIKNKYGDCNELINLVNLLVTLISEYYNKINLYNYPSFATLVYIMNTTRKNNITYEPILPFNVIYIITVQECIKYILSKYNFNYKKEGLTSYKIFQDLFEQIDFEKLKEQINNNYKNQANKIKKQDLLNDLREAEQLKYNKNLKTIIIKQIFENKNKIDELIFNNNIIILQVIEYLNHTINELTTNIINEINKNAIKKSTQSSKKEISQSTINDNISRVNRIENSFLSLAQFKADADKSMYDTFQECIDYDFDKEKYGEREQITSGIVVYEDRNHITEIIYEGAGEPKGDYDFTPQTEKVKDVLEELLVNQYLDTSNPTLFINLTTLANETGVKPYNLRKRIAYIMESLQTMRLSYKTKGKLKNKSKNMKDDRFEDFGSIRIISSSEYHSKTDVLEVNFDNKFAYQFSLHQFFQLPKKYKQINDNQFPYGYHLVKYIFRLCRENKYIIKFSSLYDEVKKIPRIEKLKEQKASPTQKIYEPLIKTFNKLNSLGDFIIKFENENFLIQNSSKKNIDWEKMLNTNIIINWSHKPNYNNINKQKQKKQQEIKNTREQQYVQAINKKALK